MFFTISAKVVAVCACASVADPAIMPIVAAAASLWVIFVFMSVFIFGFICAFLFFFFAFCA